MWRIDFWDLLVQTPELNMAACWQEQRLRNC